MRIMTDKQSVQDVEERQLVPAYGYDLLRQDVLPELLGEDEAVILYWAGKSLARKKMKDVESIGIENFFNNANWGKIKQIKEKGEEKIYELTATHQNKDRPFSLEAGFLAQITENEKALISEASYSIKKKKPLTVSITVKWDRKDPAREIAL
jgi:predicted hydrocarbon binding protein